jgi:hypothetical protein
VAGCCECGDEPSGSCATELVIANFCFFEMKRQHFIILPNSYTDPKIDGTHRVPRTLIIFKICMSSMVAHDCSSLAFFLVMHGIQNTACLENF